MVYPSERINRFETRILYIEKRRFDWHSHYMTDHKNSFFIKNSFGEFVPNRPEPITQDIEVVPYKKRMSPAYALEALLEGYSVLITDFYGSGLEVLKEISKYINQKHTGQSFQDKRTARAAYQKLSNQVFLKVINHKMQVRKAPEIGWLKILYPNIEEFLLPLPQVQGLNSSWQWYSNGLYIPVLRKKLNVWYGTYFPTRFEHLELFENWLRQFKGEKGLAIDTGIGCGVLSTQMLKHGFTDIYGTDTNPNAIISVGEYIDQNNLQSKLKVFHGDLFTNCPQEADLIVFNPPWLPADSTPESLDAAIYYPDELFPRFFEEAAKHLKRDGRLVLLFSNLAEVSGLSIEHPIQEELEKGNRFSKVQLITKQVRSASSKTKRDSSARANEKVELWELKLNS